MYGVTCEHLKRLVFPASSSPWFSFREMLLDGVRCHEYHRSPMSQTSRQPLAPFLHAPSSTRILTRETGIASSHSTGVLQLDMDSLSGSVLRSHPPPPTRLLSADHKSSQLANQPTMLLIKLYFVFPVTTPASSIVKKRRITTRYTKKQYEAPHIILTSRIHIHRGVFVCALPSFYQPRFLFLFHA